ncbi:hypothetical protein PA598K_03338 [Paenibacillus sp. 598K]|nr:hypothetical protein PA598K_03338 [Paenibacillus sp. 598K]
MWVEGRRAAQGSIFSKETFPAQRRQKPNGNQIRKNSKDGANRPGLEIYIHRTLDQRRKVARLSSTDGTGKGDRGRWRNESDV